MNPWDADSQPWCRSNPPLQFVLFLGMATAYLVNSMSGPGKFRRYWFARGIVQDHEVNDLPAFSPVVQIEDWSVGATVVDWDST